MLISDKLKTTKFTESEEEIVRYFLEQKDGIAKNLQEKFQNYYIVHHHR